MSHERYLSVARSVSQTSDFPKHKLGCAIVYKGNIASVAHNSEKTHTMQMKFNRFRNLGGDHIICKVHAELAALSKIRYLDIDWSKAIVYVYREFKNGNPAIARPCEGCMEAIRQRGIRTIVYSTDQGFAVEKIN